MKTATIVCPVCFTKQNAIIHQATAPVIMIPNSADGRTPTGELKLYEGCLYIRCAYLPCQVVITDDVLDDLLTVVVKYPSDLLKISQY